MQVKQPVSLYKSKHPRDMSRERVQHDCGWGVGGGGCLIVRKCTPRPLCKGVNVFCVAMVMAVFFGNFLV